jgi:GntR family transcriptional repressor for pyruvate dehydrogenase complex
MKYKQIKPKKIYEEVAEELIEMIKSGQLKPGEKLDSVQQLAESFQVSRSAIREALSALKAMGLIDLRQGEGTYIREFDPKQLSFPLSTAFLMNKGDVAQLLEVRKILEIGVVASAANNRSEQNLSAMHDALMEMKLAYGNEELGEKADYAFHLAIAEASQNELLRSLMNHVSSLLIETMRETRKIWLFSKKTSVERLYDEHQMIYEAIFDQNAKKAQQAMRDHLQTVEDMLSSYFEEAGEK